ncbi:MAG: hypothetical protein K2Y33_09305 [Mycolicibacterium frederiksbergense]|nr:hypothetical protein [Mycolicibacterium frederiksbergense]
MLLNPAGETITPQRYTEVFGESDWVDLSAISNVVIALDAPSADGQAAGKSYMQTGSLFAPRGSDLKDRDRFTYQDKTFGVVGDARWNQNHPFTGANFGYVEYAIRLGG